MLTSKYVTMGDFEFLKLPIKARLALMKDAYNTIQFQIDTCPDHPLKDYQDILLPKPPHEDPNARSVIAVPLPTQVVKNWTQYCPEALKWTRTEAERNREDIGDELSELIEDEGDDLRPNEVAKRLTVKVPTEIRTRQLLPYAKG